MCSTGFIASERLERALTEAAAIDSIVKLAAESHGESVSVCIQLGRGTTFTVRLPLPAPDHDRSFSPTGQLQLCLPDQFQSKLYLA